MNPDAIRLGRLMRFRLVTLFAFMTFLAALVAAIVSHRRVWEEISRLDEEVKSAMLSVHPTAIIFMI